MALASGNLVVYRQRPARVERVEQGGSRVTIVEADGRSRTIREKDVRFLHAGPVRDLSALDKSPEDLDGVRELLAEEAVPFADFVALCFSEVDPAAAWSAWMLLFEGRQFIERDGLVHARSNEEIARLESARQEREAEAARWQAFRARVAAGRCDLDRDAGYIEAIRRFVSGANDHCALLAELNCAREPAAAHALLLRIGACDERWVPAALRCGIAWEAPADRALVLPPCERVDHGDCPAWAIDDAGNEDPDDAIAFDGERIWVHVADVGALVLPDEADDLTARERGATWYAPDCTVPMLPPAYARLLGLGLDHRSPALSIAFRVDAAGDLHDVLVERSWVRVDRLSYQEADPLCDDGPLVALAEALAPAIDARHARAQADFELPEVRIRVDGDVIDIAPLHRGPARTLVMEAMLQAGAALSAWAGERAVALPHTGQAPPAGQACDPGGGLAGQWACMRQMAPSRQQVEPALHAGLGLERYVRATSPLRRYGDCLVHQQIQAVLSGREPLTAAILAQRLAVGNEAALRIRRAERVANRHWTLAYLRRHPDWRGEAVVVERQERGATVLLPALGLSVPVRWTSVERDQVVPIAIEDIDLARQELRLRRLG